VSAGISKKKVQETVSSTLMKYILANKERAENNGKEKDDNR